MSAHAARAEALREELVARAAADRAAISKQLAVLRSIEGGIAQLGQVKPELPAIAVGAGLGLSALLLALPTGQGTVLRAGIAMFRLAGSVRRLLTGR